MLSLRLITTGLNDIHSVIGYVLAGPATLGEGSSIREAIIQPRENTAYSYEAMHDINGLSIPYLREFGADRKETLDILLNDIDCETILVWYKPFIAKYLKQVEEETDRPYRCTLIDLHQIAKQKGLDSSSFKLADVYEYTGTEDLFQLYSYLSSMPEPTRLKRV